MKIITCCKIVPNEEGITVLPNRELSMANAPLAISQYDLNAMESGKQLAAETKGSMVAYPCRCCRHPHTDFRFDQRNGC